MTIPQPVLRTPIKPQWLWTPKLWGRTRRVIGTATVEIWEAHFRAGGYTSIHYHERRNQLCTVVSGVLGMTFHDAAGRKFLQLSIPAGASYFTSAGIRHQLTGETDCVVLEQYNPAFPGWTLEGEDIVRLSEGGQG